MMKIKTKNYIKSFKKVWKQKEEKEIDNLQNLVIEKLSLKEINKQIIKKEDYESYVSENNVYAIIPKYNFLKILIENNFIYNKKNKEETKNLFKAIGEYKQKEDVEISCLFNPSILNILIDLSKSFKEVKLKIKNESPLYLETKDFICLLAPIVHPEDEKKI